MIYRGTWDNTPLVISHKPHSLTVSLGPPEAARVYTYDAAGRPWSFYMDGVSYRRGLNGRMLARWRDATGERQRRWYSTIDALRVMTRAHAELNALYIALERWEVPQEPEIPVEVFRFIRRALAYDVRQAAHEVAAYHNVYKPVGILPPDQYLAVMVQATEGCSFNTCTFCTFYKAIPFHVKTPQAYRAHVAGVRELLGDGLSLRRSVFFGDANALVVPMPQLMPLVEITREAFDVDALGLYAFLDGFSGEKKTAADYATLAGAGLRRVYIGLESGDPTLLHDLGKPATPRDSIQAVHALKAGGVAVGVIVLLGAGGEIFHAGHVSATIEALNAMELGRGDLIYFSELVTTPGQPYANKANVFGMMDHDARVAQGAEIRAGLRFAADDAPTLSRYDIRDFIY